MYKPVCIAFTTVTTQFCSSFGAPYPWCHDFFELGVKLRMCYFHKEEQELIYVGNLEMSLQHGTFQGKPEARDTQMSSDRMLFCSLYTT